MVTEDSEHRAVHAGSHTSYGDWRVSRIWTSGTTRSYFHVKTRITASVKEGTERLEAFLIAFRRG